jgi:hypothetical protein
VLKATRCLSTRELHGMQTLPPLQLQEGQASGNPLAGQAPEK